MTHTQPLPAGTIAPDLDLPSSAGDRASLTRYRGRPVILAFYPADWSPVCTDQLSLYQAVLPEFDAHDAALLAISVDGTWCHRAFARDRHLTFPILADFEPKGAASRSYGVYDPVEGTSERALFVIDANGRIAWSYRSPPNVNPGADGILRALEGLQARSVPA